MCRIPVFPVSGAILFPGLQLPLYIFEPRYRAMVARAIATDRLIGMIQPRPRIAPMGKSRLSSSGNILAQRDELAQKAAGLSVGAGVGADSSPPLFDVGCLGKITEIEALEDGCYNLVLEGQARFSVLREVETGTPYRQCEVTVEGTSRDDDVLASISRASLEREARRFAERQGYVVDWTAVTSLDDRTLVNGIAQIAPFDAAAKQALLEAPNLADRTELVVQLMQFFGRHDGDNQVTLQ